MATYSFRVVVPSPYGLTFVESGTTAVTEGGATDTYTVALRSAPTANVTVTLGVDSQVAVTSNTLNFTPANWNVPQTVTVAAVDDVVAEGNHIGVVTHLVTSADANYNNHRPVFINATITDNDTPRIVVTESGNSTTVTEGSAVGDTYTVVLSSRPTADVTIALNPGSQLGVAPAALLFTPNNWNTPRTVTVTALDDLIAEGNHAGTVLHTATSADANYNGISVPGVTAFITDNDRADMVVVQSSGNTMVTEGGGSDTYTVVLTSQPTANVVVTLNSGPQLNVSPAMLTFTPANWNTAQTVTVTPVDDRIAEGDHTGSVSHTVVSTDANYNGFNIANVTVAITDNDQARIVITESGGNTTVTEGGGSDSYTVILTSQPTADVVVTVAAGPQLAAAPATLTFTATNWNTAQTVTVTAVDDRVAEGNHSGTVTHTAASADPNYGNANVANVVVSITDNDQARVVLSESGGNTAVAEGGPGDTYTLVLTSQPTADVVITVSPEALLTAVPPTLTFTPANWNTAQTVTVGAVDNFRVDSPRTARVSHAAASADGNYNGGAANIPAVTVAIADNDAAGVVVAESGNNTTATEGGVGDTYTLVLTSQPSAPVTITLTADAQAMVSPTTLVFNAATWNIPQSVALTAVDDSVVEGAHTARVTHAATSADADYQGITIRPVVVVITDNDMASVRVDETGGNTTVSEGGATDRYSVVLTSQPTADVTITLSSKDNQVTFDPVLLMFTPSSWSTPKFVEVAAVDDAAVEGPHITPASK